MLGQVHGGWEPRLEQDGRESYAYRDDLALLHTGTWTWTTPKLLGPAPCARVGHSLVPLPSADGGTALMLFGGRADGEVALNDTHALRPVGCDDDDAMAR